MTHEQDLNELRARLKFPSSALSRDVAMRLIQELEETRAKHRKEWGRAEAAEKQVEIRANDSIAARIARQNVKAVEEWAMMTARIEAAEQAVQRVRAALGSEGGPFEIRKAVIRRALDGKAKS